MNKEIQLMGKRYMRWLGQAALAAGVVLALAACGGGSGQVEPFEPTRIIAMGDQTSVHEADGRKYTVNALATGGAALDCETHPIWVQVVADVFDLKFPQCPGDDTAPTGVMLAANGAKAADIEAQVNAVAASFGEDDLVTMLVGANDIFELYAQFPTRSEADIGAELRARGRAWGAQINRVAQAGPAVLVVTVPDLGKTPFALAEESANAGRASLLSRLTDQYNAGMRLEIINDGRLIGLAFGDLEVQNIVRFPGAFGFANVTEATCLASAPLPTCTTATLIADPDVDPVNWLWADDRHLSPGGHNRIGVIAATRARNNPF
jgi:outer membrane lipase/esterase